MEQRVRLRSLDLLNAAIPVTIAAAEFAAQVVPLEVQLALRDCDALCTAGAPDLAGVEAIPSSFSFRMDAGQERIHGTDRTRVLAKARELRMMAVAARAAEKDLPCEQCLSPGCCEACRIQIPRME